MKKPDPFLKTFASRVQKELDKNLLPFWTERTLDREKGGFIGYMDSRGQVNVETPKGLVLNARFLWTWSSLTRRRETPSSASLMNRAYDFLTERFADTRFGGYFWTLDRDGKPIVDQKKTYGQAFVLYALSEYLRTTASPNALAKARDLFERIESQCRDPIHDGYFETFERDWTPSQDMRLSSVDMDEKKSMNTHLHLLEAYAALYRVWKDPGLRQRLDSLFGIFLDHIIDSSSGHFRLFFDEGWTSKSDRISFGHDIEGCWLISEAADVLGDPSRTDRIRRWSARLASRILEKAWDDVHGGIFNEGGPSGVLDRDKVWWVQAEAVVGFLDAYSKSGDRQFLDAGCRTWEFIENVLADREFGEWRWKVSADNRPDPDLPKVSEWKCPYHSVRVCLEATERLSALQKEALERP